MFIMEKEVFGKVKDTPKPGLIDGQDDLLSLNTSENVSAWPVLLQRSALIDSDNDGMPDAWEKIRIKSS